MVQAIHQTTEILQLLFDFRSSMSLLCRVVQVLRCCCEEDRVSSFFGRPRCSASWLVRLKRTVMPRHSCAWLVLLVTIQLALCSLTRFWTCPLCATSGAGRDCAQLWRSPQLQFIGQLVRRLRRLLEEFTMFLRESEPRSRGRLSPWKSGHYFYKQYLAVHTSATEAFGKKSGFCT